MGGLRAAAAWITRHRRTVRDYERLAAHHEACVYWAMIVMTAASPASPSLSGQQPPEFLKQALRTWKGWPSRPRSAASGGRAGAVT